MSFPLPLNTIYSPVLHYRHTYICGCNECFLHKNITYFIFSRVFKFYSKAGNGNKLPVLKTFYRYMFGLYVCKLITFHMQFLFFFFFFCLSFKRYKVIEIFFDSFLFNKKKKVFLFKEVFPRIYIQIHKGSCRFYPMFYNILCIPLVSFLGPHRFQEFLYFP